jgi:hypothetical protein
MNEKKPPRNGGLFLRVKTSRLPALHLSDTGRRRYDMSLIANATTDEHEEIDITPEIVGAGEEVIWGHVGGAEGLRSAFLSRHLRLGGIGSGVLVDRVFQPVHRGFQRGYRGVAIPCARSRDFAAGDCPSDLVRHQLVEELCFNRMSPRMVW